MFNLVSQGVSLGFSAGAMPGPFQSYLISSALAYGWRKSLIIIFSPLITDGPIILLTVFILRQVPDGFIQIVRIVGGLYLLWIAFRAWQRYRAGVTFDAANSPARSHTLTQGLLMNWLSPGPYLFWGTINGPLLVQGLEQSAWHGLVFLLAFYGTFLGFLALYVLVFDRLRRLDEKITRAIFVLTIGVLVVFGLSLVGQGIGQL
jgi:threonine/homoserine/homoserine lactone efflux protein